MNLLNLFATGDADAVATMKSFFALLDRIHKIGDVEKAEQQAITNKNNAQAEHERFLRTAAEDKNRAAAEVIEINKSKEGIIEKANTDAAAMRFAAVAAVEKAKNDAERIMQDASDRSDQMAANTRHSLELVRIQIDDEQKRLTALQAEISEVKKVRDALVKERDEFRKRMTAIG